MERKFPRYFLIALALYAVTSIATVLFFIVPALLSELAVYIDFYLYLLLVLLPLILSIIYSTTEVGKRHGTAFRLAVVASTTALSLVFILVISPLLSF